MTKKEHKQFFSPQKSCRLHLVRLKSLLNKLAASFIISQSLLVLRVESCIHDFLFFFNTKNEENTTQTRNQEFDKRYFVGFHNKL
jgi:hypothetical protein